MISYMLPGSSSEISQVFFTFKFSYNFLTGNIFLTIERIPDFFFVLKNLQEKKLKKNLEVSSVEFLH